MTDTNYRSIFVSHGAPTLALADHPARDFLVELGRSLPKPRAVVVISPHWQTTAFAVKQAGRFTAWHDFGGFPRELYELRYEPPGEPALAARIEAQLADQNLPTQLISDTRIDHGVWIPLMLMFPQADVPVVPVSVRNAGPEEHLKLGRALAGLDDGVLILGSGGAVHNLHEISPPGTPAPDWAMRFDDWTRERVTRSDWDELVRYRSLAPEATRAHPTEEHFMPLFVAGGAGAGANVLHQSFSYGGLGMAAYGFAKRQEA
ncbi:MAG: DODA-type extradiol aromatic ring-opening family dioxygenase [Stenotrophobium sp.]